MLADGAKSGMVSIDDPAVRFTVLDAVIKAGRPFRDHMKMVNGRVIAVLHQPMMGGGWISMHEDVTEQHKHEEMIRHLARHDALTDLPNRVLFKEEMAKIEARIKRQENCIGAGKQWFQHFCRKRVHIACYHGAAVKK